MNTPAHTVPTPLRLTDILHPVVAGIVSVIVNYGGTFILVFQAAKLAGLSPALTSSWVWSVSIGVGLSGLVLSWYSREPVITAWSTPAAAFLVTALASVPYSDAIGAYLLSAAGFVMLGVTGYFERLVRAIPGGIAAGLLAGILLQFGIGAFGGLSVDPALAGLLIAAYVTFKRFTARYAVVGILLLGLGYLLLQGQVDLTALRLEFATPLFTAPTFSLNAALSVALPLFLITLTGQYMPGMLVLRNDGFKTSANPIVAVTGLGSLLMAPFGSHAFNIAAITAAICTGKEAHEDPGKRWVAGIAAGVCYILVGIFGVTLASVFMALPATFITTLAGLALLGTIGASLANAMADARSREAALITFLAAAANINLFGIGGAFWGLVIGLLAYAVLNGRLPGFCHFSR
ncbi:benzoate/H(+) symporter BenE family transporter [Pseudomonas asiatica]|uniref:benzoate/H(+) symporter BenE family transporter n=1 Tax=Pseudomonas TaxID=286 RepID=UPI00064CB726|nr:MULTISPECIES: benzoate/H(+) symporter BenE family transporter [Pseudomonas]MBH3378269.1 benzoate/H(+) symporter BenE family transporter [Pseudomonas asiatica]MBO2893088.1 benzoate/H(+) symporter BenE family transporter [Pseudomonas asiatica]MCK2123661.1 benzoate/H(+) symporter BenE family transporter [Pseudomonas sp. PNPG3]MDM9587907.1 benzoate/H(+) symporter BenE family transporter [Pseudomonas asiatica]WDM90942.1 benzoate/H(+) symporter BenE family transporter [Pseudomonas asiatica]